MRERARPRRPAARRATRRRRARALVAGRAGRRSRTRARRAPRTAGGGAGRRSRSSWALVSVAGAGAAAASAPHSDVGRWVRGVLGAGERDARPVLGRVPGGGRLLVQAGSSAWVVSSDGAKRRLGAYAGTSWSPHGLFVVGWRGRELTALDPGGAVRWSLASRERVGIRALGAGRRLPDRVRRGLAAADRQRRRQRRSRLRPRARGGRAGVAARRPARARVRRRARAGERRRRRRAPAAVAQRAAARRAGAGMVAERAAAARRDARPARALRPRRPAVAVARDPGGHSP